MQSVKDMRVPPRERWNERKQRLKYLVKLLEERINEDSKRINQFLFKLFVSDYCSVSNNLDTLKEAFGQIFRVRGNRV